MLLSPADEPVLRAATGSARATDRTIVLLLIAALFGVLLIRLGLNALLPLADTTEARYGEIARVGVAHGYWLMPHSSPELPFFAKPPASTWLAMISATLLGVSEFSLRLPSLLTMAIVILITMRLAARGGSITQVSPLFAALIVASAPLGFIAAGAVMTDAVQCLAVTVAMACATRLITASPDRRARWRNGFWAAVGLGTLAKGLATVALIAFPIFLYGLALRAPWQTWRVFFSIPALGLALVLALPWYLLAEVYYPGFLSYFIVGEHFMRFIEPGWKGDRYGSAHIEPIGMIWAFTVMSLGPWLLAWLMPRGAGVPDDAGQAAVAPPGRLWWWCWTLAPLLMFTAARNIIWTYCLTAIPPFALLLAPRLATLSNSRLRIAAVAGLIWVAILAVIAPIMFSRLNAGSARYLMAQVDRIDPEGRLPLSVPGSLRFSGAFYSRGRTCIGIDPVSQAACYARGDGLRIISNEQVAPQLAAGQIEVLMAHDNYTLVRPIAPVQGAR
jgi:4-amino-4-deoxy-L-arabinose transferase-like glycosyltransferase